MVKRIAVAIFAVVLGTIVYLVLAATAFGPADEHGARVEQLTIDSAAVGRELEVSVVVPARLPEPRGERPLVVFLHGVRRRGDLHRNDPLFAGLRQAAAAAAPIVAFPDGGDHSYCTTAPRATGAAT